MRNFRDLKVWQKSHELTLEVYKVTNTFLKSEVYGLGSQLRRASASIPTKLQIRVTEIKKMLSSFIVSLRK